MTTVNRIPSPGSIERLLKIKAKKAESEIKAIGKSEIEKNTAISKAVGEINEKFRKRGWKADRSVRNMIEKIGKMVDGVVGNLLNISDEWPPPLSFDDLSAIKKELDKCEEEIGRLKFEFLRASPRCENMGRDFTGRKSDVILSGSSEGKLLEYMKRVRDWEALKERYK